MLIIAAGRRARRRSSNSEKPLSRTRMPEKGSQCLTATVYIYDAKDAVPIRRMSALFGSPVHDATWCEAMFPSLDGRLESRIQDRLAKGMQHAGQAVTISAASRSPSCTFQRACRVKPSRVQIVGQGTDVERRWCGFGDSPADVRRGPEVWCWPAAGVGSASGCGESERPRVCARSAVTRVCLRRSPSCHAT